MLNLCDSCKDRIQSSRIAFSCLKRFSCKITQLANSPNQILQIDGSWDKRLNSFLQQILCTEWSRVWGQGKGNHMIKDYTVRCLHNGANLRCHRAHCSNSASWPHHSSIIPSTFWPSSRLHPLHSTNLSKNVKESSSRLFHCCCQLRAIITEPGFGATALSQAPQTLILQAVRRKASAIYLFLRAWSTGSNQANLCFPKIHVTTVCGDSTSVVWATR